jgi:hypothetical protein
MAAVEFFDYEEAMWKEFAVNIGGANCAKIEGAKYGVESDDKPLHAGGDEPISIQSGNRTYTGTIKVLKGALDDMNIAARAAGARDVTDIKMDVVVTYLPAIGRPIQTDVWVGFKISKMEKGWDQGAKEMIIELPGNFLRLKSI